MSTKQLRLSDPALIKEKIGTLIGKKISIVLADDTSVFGELCAVLGANIQIMNMRLRRNIYPISNIAEVYVDINA